MNDAQLDSAASRQAHQPLSTHVAAVVFDCDGLLVDTEPCWSRAEAALFRAHGHEFGLAQKKMIIGRTLEDAGKVMAEYFARPGEGDRVAAELMARVQEELEAGAEALPGAEELVRACASRVPVAVASNSPRILLDLALTSSALARLLPVSFAADEVAAPKPEPHLYIAACEALGADPAESVAFEDSGTGVMAARAAGMCLVTVPSLPGQELDHDWEFGSLADPVLQRWAQELT